MSENMTTAPRTIVMSEGGKGKKLCPYCKKYIGIASKICKLCGSDLQEGIVRPKSSEPTKPSPKPKSEKVESEPRLYHGRGSYVLCPGGQSLKIGLGAKLKSLEPDEIASWANKVLELGDEHGIRYSPSALRYFLRYFYDINSPEFKIARKHLGEWSQVHFAVEGNEN